MREKWTEEKSEIAPVQKESKTEQKSIEQAAEQETETIDTNTKQHYEKQSVSEQTGNEKKETEELEQRKYLEKIERLKELIAKADWEDAKRCAREISLELESR